MIFYYLRILTYVLILLFTSCQTLEMGGVGFSKQEIREITEVKEVKYITLRGEIDDINFINSKDLILDFF